MTNFDAPPELMKKYRKTEDPRDNPRAHYDGRQFHWTTDSLDAGRVKSNHLYNLHPSYYGHPPSPFAAPKAKKCPESSPQKLTKRALCTLVEECFELGKQAAEADWDADDLLQDPTPNGADPRMMNYRDSYPSEFGTLLKSWKSGYNEQAELSRLEEGNSASSTSTPGM